MYNELVCCCARNRDTTLGLHTEKFDPRPDRDPVIIIYPVTLDPVPALLWFLPRCMECICCLATKILSVRLSVKRVNCDKTEERSVQIFVYERAFSLVFWKEECLVGCDPFCMIIGSTGPRWSEIADFEPIFARSASAITPSKNVQLTLIISSLRAFQQAYDHRTLLLSPPPGRRSSKTQNGRFPSKIALSLKKVCYKVSLCENCLRQSCKALIGLTIPAKMIGGVRPLLPEILTKSDRVGAKSPIFDLFSLLAPQP